MTANEMKKVLDLTFKKWKVTEEIGFLVITVRGPISNFEISQLENVRPAHVTFYFYTMGFWESLFTKNRSWKVKK